MALALELSNLDGLDDAVKGLYVESDGAFKLDVSGLPEMPDVTGLKTALQSERDAAKQAKLDAKTMADKFEGVDADKYKQLIADMERAEEKKLIDDNKADEVWSNRTDKLNKEWQTKLDAETAKIADEHEINVALKMRALQGELSMQLVGVEGMHDFGKRDALKAALDAYTLGNDGKAVMNDADGNVIIGKDGSTPFSFGEEARSGEFREKNPHWFTATGGGSGMVQGQKQSGSLQNMDGLNRIERMEKQLELEQVVGM